MLTSISQFQKAIWNQWNIRIVILFSLFLQIFLIVSAPCRKRTRGPLVFFVWLAYLLADWAAGYCIGLISNNQEQKSNLSQNDYLVAFWGPFLLLHLGGPDSISAFALEDNELWLRHLLALIFQSVTAAYVFLLTVPHNKLWLPTILMFVAGLIKYAERIHALYVAAISNFRKSLLPKPDAGPNYAKLMEEHSSRRKAGLPAKIIVIPELRQGSDEATKDEERVSEPTQRVLSNVELVQKAFFFFQKFQGLIVDMIYSFKDRLDSQQYLEGKTAEDALRLIEIELNFMYEVFYTKASVIRHYRVWFWGKLVSLVSIISTIVLFIKEERHGKGFNKLDVKVTYALLSGAIILDFMALFMRFFTDYTATLSDVSLLDSYSASWHQKLQVRLFRCLNERFLAWFLWLREPTWSKIPKGRPYAGSEKLSTKFFFRRWCGSISGYNLLNCCLDESIPSFSIVQRVCFRMVACVQNLFYDLLNQWRYQSTNPFLKEVWEYVYGKLKQKSHVPLDIEAIQSICSARGEWVVKKEKLESLKPFVDPNEVAFDQSLLLWHIATALCYTKDINDEGEKQDESANDESFERKEKKKKDKGRNINMLIQEIKNKSLLLWHFISTLCQAKEDVGVEEQNEQKDEKDKRMNISMLLSDYMLYLLVMQPNLMSAIAGIGQIRFQDTCEEAQRFLRKRISAQGDRGAMLKDACKTLMKVPTEQKPIDVKGDRSKSLLFDACRLARELGRLGDETKWEVIASVWVELLSYAACHCRPTGHVQLLSKGGELISFVWLLMCHLGLSTQFQIKDGDARAKLIVGK